MERAVLIQWQSRVRTMLLGGLLAVGLSANAKIDTVTVAFQQLTIDDGLSQGMVFDILQDRSGFMWFTTKDGLNRYDGYSFRVFRHDPKDSTSLATSYVLNLLESRNGLLWIGTNEGMDVFDPATEIFHHVTFPTGAGASQTASDAVNGIVQDPLGRIWARNERGVFVIDEPLDLNASSPIKATPAPFTSALNALTMDSHGMLRAWGSLTGTSVKFDTRRDDAGLDTIRYMPETTARHAPKAVVAMMLLACEDTLRNRTYGVHSKGILRLDGPGPPQPINVDAIHFEDLQAIGIGASGEIWITDKSTFFRFDPTSGHLNLVLPLDVQQNKVLAGAIRIYTDRGGVLWIGTTGYGILRYDPRGERFHSNVCGSVRWVTPSNDGRLMLWTDSAYFYDPHTLRIEDRPLFNTDAQGRKVTVNNLAPCFVQSADGRFWSNVHGILRHDGLSGHRRHFPDSAYSLRFRFPDTPAFPLYIGGDTTLFFGGHGEFVGIDMRTGKIKAAPYPVPGQGGFYTFLQAIHRDPEGIFWLGTVKGLLRFDQRMNTWTPPPGSPAAPYTWIEDVIFCVLDDPQDPLNFLWAGTDGGGLYRLDKNTGEYTQYGLTEGLPNEVIYGLLADDDGLLWMSSNKGLTRLDPATGVIRNYDTSDGLQSNEFNRYAYCKLADGTMVFGGVNGLNQFNPRELRDDPRPVQVAITEIRLMNKMVEFGRPDSLLRMPAHLAHMINIPYQAAGMLTIGFASMEYSSISNRQYSYQLDGFDPRPIQAGNEHIANYTNLSPGEYTFKVWGSNRDGVWNQAPTTMLVRILPPWYMTRWAKGLFALVLIGLVLLYLHLRTRTLRHQRSRLEQTVQQRTAEMRAAKERAERSERVKEQFLANMSHEIRTPMHAIVGMNNVLRRKTHLPEQEPYLEAIAQSSTTLLGLVNHILDLSKIEAGRLEPEKLPMEPRTVLADVAGVMRHRVEEKKLTLNTAVSDAVPKVLIGDQVRLNQVLMNLVGNAIKFTDRGSIQVAMDAKPLDTGAVMLRCTVADTGIGIPPDRLASVFNQFTQADNSHTRKYGGSGLGLTISKRLVEMQGGTITVESTLGKGTTFTVAVPYELPQESSSPETTDTTATPERKDLEGLYLLLVEDHVINVMVAKEQLTDAIPNVRIDVADNGKVAVAMASAADYDLILMDVQMPVMDGYEATHAIRSLEGDGPHVPIVGVTANVMRAELDRCIEAGMDGYVTKPFVREELLDAMAKALENSER